MPTNLAVLDHDVVLTRGTGARIGLMLVQSADEEGNPLPKRWRMSEIPVPVGIRVTDEGLGTSDLPPDMQATLFRDNHSAGMGHISEVFIVNGKSNYESGTVASYHGTVVKPPAADEITLPTTEGDVRVWAEFDSALYVSDGRYLHRSTDGTTFTEVLDVGATNVITDATAYGASDGDAGLVVAFQDSSDSAQPYYWSTDGTTFTQVTADATREFHFWVVQNKTLFGMENPNVYRTTTDPFTATATWGGATEAGDKAHDFRGATVIAGVLMFFKEDRVYTVDAAGAVSILVEQFASNPGTHNFAARAAAFNSNIYFTVNGEVWEYDPVAGNIRPMGVLFLPDTLLNLTDITEGLAYDGGALFTIHPTNFDSSGTSILRITQARPPISRLTESAEGVVPERWLLQTSTGFRPQGPLHATRMFSTRKTGRALYFNTTTAGKVGVLNLFRSWNPAIDSVSEFSTADAKLRSGWMSHNFPALQKDYTEVVVDVQGLDSTTTLDVFYFLNGDTTTRRTLTVGINSDGLHRLEFPVLNAESFPYTFPIDFSNTVPSQVSGRSFNLEFVLISDDVANTPEIKSWAVHAAVKFTLREIIEMTFRVADNVETRNGGRSEFTAAGIRDFLRTTRGATNETIEYKDWTGYEFTNIRLLPGFAEEPSVDMQRGPNETMMTAKLIRSSEQA